eukprot:PhF_6_TR13355/c0_g1_i1/m.21155
MSDNQNKPIRTHRELINDVELSEAVQGYDFSIPHAPSASVLSSRKGAVVIISLFFFFAIWSTFRSHESETRLPGMVRDRTPYLRPRHIDPVVFLSTPNSVGGKEMDQIYNLVKSRNVSFVLAPAGLTRPPPPPRPEEKGGAIIWIGPKLAEDKSSCYTELVYVAPQVAMDVIVVSDGVADDWLTKWFQQTLDRCVGAWRVVVGTSSAIAKIRPIINNGGVQLVVESSDSAGNSVQATNTMCVVTNSKAPNAPWISIHEVYSKTLRTESLDVDGVNGKFGCTSTLLR